MEKLTVLITGASSGIGKSAANLLLEKGYEVYTVARRKEKMLDLQENGAIILKMDITNDASIKETVNTIIQNSGKIDVLVNNAGYGAYGTVEDTPIQTAREQFEVNLFGLSALTKEIIPYMREKGRGKIINVSSVGGKIYSPYGAYYHATKHALEGYSDCLRYELRPFNIKVVIVEPGIIMSEWSGIAGEMLVHNSGSGPYSEHVKKYVRAFNQMYTDRKSSQPSIIGKLITKIVVKRNPKPRYAAGYLSGIALFSRKYFSDRLFDWTLRKQFDLLSKN